MGGNDETEAFDVLEQEARDHFNYPLLQNHLDIVEAFIEDHRARGHAVLVHCYAGMNRSAAICAGYLIRRHRIPLLETVELLVKRRGIVLSNSAFIQQLVALAREEDLTY